MTETLPPSSPNGQFPAAWYVWAVNLGDGTAVMLDQAESQPAIEEPPVPSIEATLVVWDTPRTSGGGETLRTYDLATKQGTTLPLPPTVYPVHPQVRGGVIYFMDNATDPHRNNETVISRGGQVVGWHLGSGVLSRLPTALDAFNAEVGPEDVVWLDRNVQQLYVTPLTGGGPSRSLGSCVTPLIRGDTTALCLPPSQRQMTEYVLAIGRALPLPPTVDFGAPGVVVGGVLYAGGPHLTITAFHLPT